MKKPSITPISEIVRPLLDGLVSEPGGNRSTLSVESINRAMEDAKVICDGDALMRRFEIFESATMMQEQFRFPRSKKKRMQKKWRKQEKNFRAITDRCYIVDQNRMYCHPIFATKVRRIIAEHESVAITGHPCFFNPNLDFLKQ